MRSILLVVSLAVLSACAPRQSPVPATPTMPSVHGTPTPGLVVHGYIRRADGSGVPNVSICRSYASYPAVVIATSDANGYYQSDFAFIPGDEMVDVWPQAPGYKFGPPNVYWRHYCGPEDRSQDFVAAPGAAATPPSACP